ncbi:MAG: phenylacetate-CoA oxygenase/reductase subunit PaaK [Marinicaulis sp.]|nr:phenylacetate-CoA oxygenase/reductase subunit PaaK [Marinicaulis sp.]
MAKFYPLEVLEIRKETNDSVVVSLSPPPEAKDDFEFIQGQYLTFRREINGEELRRSYSICSAVSEDNLRVGIKKVDDGWFSTWANEDMKIGDIVDAMAPMGNFYGSIEPDRKKKYLGFAGGSGITPFMSIIKTVLAREPHSTFTLAYGNRSARDVMFREELEDLKNTNMGRLNIVHILETEADIDLFSGRMDKEKCDALFNKWIDVSACDQAFICGPEPMMLAVADALKAHGIAEDKIKYELFASAPRGKGGQKSASKVTDANAEQTSLTISLDGVRRDTKIPKTGVSVLEAALEAQIDAPFACKAGVCSTCRAKIVEGEAEMEVNYALEDYEVKAGYVLTCQCYPLSDSLVVDYDQ